MNVPMENSELEPIVQQAQGGDSRSFELLYNHFVNRVFGFIQQRVGNRATAEDITSEVFIKIYHNLNSYQPNGNFGAWIFTIARNAICDHWRKQVNEANMSFDDSIYVEQHNKALEEFFLDIDPELYPPEVTNEKNLDRFLDQLKGHEQDVIRERYYYNQSVKDTAKTLNITESNVKVLTHRALKKLTTLITL